MASLHSLYFDVHFSTSEEDLNQRLVLLCFCSPGVTSVHVCVDIPVHTEVVVTGPTSLMSSLSLERKRLSDTTQRPPSRHHDDDAHFASPEMTSHDDVEGGAMSDGELDRRAMSNHRILRTRFTAASQVRLSHCLHAPVLGVLLLHRPQVSHEKTKCITNANSQKNKHLINVSLIRWFTDVSRKVTFPERRFPERRFPEK